MNGEDRAAIAALESEVRGLRDDVSGLKADMKSVLAWMNQRKGALTTAALLFSVIPAMVGASVVAIFAYFTK